MKVWILQTGEPLHIDSAGLRPMRAMNLSNALIEQGHQVVLWSSDFDHFSKTHRTGKTSTIQVYENLELKLISSRGYKSHVGLSRLFDHAQLAFNLHRELRKQPAPDVAFIGYPPIETAWVMTNWLFRRKIPTLLDVKDAWPDVLLRAFPSKLQPLAKLALSPYFFVAKTTFKKSTGLCSVTQPFLNWSLNKAARSQSAFDCVVPLTTPLADFNDTEIAEAEKWLDAKGVEDNGRIRGSFVGTLNSAFDFQPIIDAANLTSTQFVIAGDGPEAANLKTNTIQMQNITMLGWISSVQAHVLSERSSFMLAPLKDLADFKLSVPNKFYDAMAHGLPIITSINGFAKNLVIQENIGMTYSNTESLCKILNKIETDLLNQMSNNSINLYNKNFSFQKVYCDLINHLKILTD